MHIVGETTPLLCIEVLTAVPIEKKKTDHRELIISIY
jgi:hypothetical protein